MPQNNQDTVRIRIQYLKSSSDIDHADQMNEKNHAIERCPSALDKSHNPIPWVDLWEMRQDDMLAGIGADNIIALECTVTVPEDISTDPDQLTLFTMRYLSGVFGEGNVLSGMSGRVSLSRESADAPTRFIFSHLLIFPLNGRQLNPMRWVDTYSKQLKREISEDYLKNLANLLGIDYQSVIAARSNGHSKYLDSFPAVQTRPEDIREIVYTTIPPNSQVQTDMPRDKIRDISNQTIEAFTTGVERGNFIKLNARDITLAKYLGEAKTYLRRLYPGMTPKDMAYIIQELSSAADGFYILDPLINDPKISDIKVVSPDKIRVKVQGSRRTSNLKFLSASDYARFLDGLITRYQLDPDKDIYVFTDKYTNPGFVLRLNLTMQSINSGCPILHIRKISKHKATIDDLIRLGVMDEQTANYLLWAARNAKGMVFTGKGSSGKTTLMNTLLDYTPSDASGLVIQESEELYSNKPEMTFEHITDQYDLKALAKNGLLTDIDYFIIGEIKGDEALDFIVAATTGNKAWCSVHGSSTIGGLDRLADYIMKANKSKYDRPQAMSMLKDLQVVVFMKNFKVAEISEITGFDPSTQTLTFRTVLKRDDLIAQTLPPSGSH